MRILLAILIIMAAAPPGTDPNSPISQWYRSLVDPRTGGSCCGEADCRHYPVEIRDGHYWVTYQGRQLMVPDSTILRGEDNPTGDYVTCIQDHWSNGEHDPQVLCFKRTPQV